MAFTIVRNDITKMNVDAIVNSTNEYLQAGGLGVDAGIRCAAGPELEKALAAIGFCPVGSAVITDAFDISSCRYIIHAVGPVYTDGRHGESMLLKKCYRSILTLARESSCASVAIPLISSGAYRYPKAEAYSIATSCIREFLLSLPEDEDMMVYMVLYDRDAVAVSEKTDAGIRHFISEAYRQRKKEQLSSLYERRRSYAVYNAEPLCGSAFRDDAPAALADSGFHTAAAPKVSLPGEGYENEDRSFADMCEWWCQQKGISKKEFYNRANINKSMFWGMKHHPEQIPKKTNALACVIGLKLNYDQAIDLLGRAGMTLSKYYETDLIVEYFIRERNYDIDEINALLYQKDLSLLGTY